MASPLTVARNDYHKNKKNSTVYTPVGVAQFLFDILHDKRPLLRLRGPCGGGGRCRPDFHTIFDPAIGSGRLTDPWFAAGRFVIGCDVIRDPDCKAREFIKGRFEDCTWYDDWPAPDLVVCKTARSTVRRASGSIPNCSWNTSSGCLGRRSLLRCSCRWASD